MSPISTKIRQDNKINTETNIQFYNNINIFIDLDDQIFICVEATVLFHLINY